MGGLPSPAEAEDIWTSIWYQEAHNSTALEGNTLVLAQVGSPYLGLAVGNKELREYMEVTGYADAAKWVYGQALDPGDWAPDAPLTMTEVRHVHGLALGPVWGVAPHPNATVEERPGSFRRHDIQPVPSAMTPHRGSNSMPRWWIGWRRYLGSMPPQIPSNHWRPPTVSSNGYIPSSTATVAPVDCCSIWP